MIPSGSRAALTVILLLYMFFFYVRRWHLGGVTVHTKQTQIELSKKIV